MIRRVVLRQMPPLYGYGMAVGSFLLALLARQLFNVPDAFPYLTFFPAVLLTTLLAGLGPGLLCAALSGGAALSLFGDRIGSPFDRGDTAFSLVMFTVIVLLLMLLLHALGKAMRDIAAAEARASELAGQRQLLYSELQHRISNNLQIVAALLRLEQNRTGDVEARKAMTEAAGRLSLIGSIQRRLLDAEGQPQAFGAFAEDLCREALEAAGASGVTLSVEPSDHTLTADQATPVCLVMLECVNNALEHGFPDGREGRLSVRLTGEGQTLRLEIADDGAGPPAGFVAGEGQSHGLRIVTALARQLRGRFDLEPGPTGGAVCRLEFPRA